MKNPIIITSQGRTQRVVRMRKNLDYYGIARRKVALPITYNSDIDVSAIIIK